MLSKTIHALRTSRGLTQAELAAQIDVHQTVLTRWEKGQAQPRSKALLRLAEVFGVTVQELMAGDLNGISSTLHEVNDPELAELFGQVNKLNERERDALKIFMRAMLAQVRMEEALGRARPEPRPADKASRAS